MKTHLPFALMSILVLLSFNSKAQVPDSTYYNRLFYVCKAWGHAKYYHTEIAKGNINWDDKLIDALAGIKAAPNNESFNDSLLLLLNSAGVMQISSDTVPNIPDSLNNNNDYSWIQNPVLSDSVRVILTTIKNRFRPQSNIYVEKTLAGNSTFTTDSLYYSSPTYPTEELRILALFRYWNIINYFFPYKHIMDQDWDTTLIETIPEIIGASDATSYNLALKQFTAKINDSHSFYSSFYYWNWIGRYHPPFLVRYIENEMVITKVLPQASELKPGDIIKKLDGNDIYNLRDELRKYAHGSNDIVIERELNRMLTRGTEGAFSVTVDDGSNVQTAVLSRNSTNDDKLLETTTSIWRDTTINGDCNFGIVDMGRLEIEDVGAMFDDLWDTDAIIFDLRNYPNETLWEIVNYLYTSPIHIVNFNVPDITYPGRLYWRETIIGTGTANPYTGKLMILFDERTQSQAEYTCMGLEQFPGAIKIGSTTSAADGNVSRIFLPGYINTYATFLGTYYPDYTPTQRIGIIPDFEVHSTISGIRNGRDEVLEFALNCNLLGIEVAETEDNLLLYPNPATNELNYQLITDNTYLLEIYSLQGHLIRSINKNSQSGRINISNLKSGTYILKTHSNSGIETQLFIKQ